MGHLASGNVKETWQTLLGWYRKAEDKAPEPCYDSIEEQTLKQEQLYDHVPPPGDPISSHIDCPPMEDSHPSDQEVRRAVKKGGNKRSGGASKMQTEDLKI